MPSEKPLKIGITCYPSVGGSGILATALGEELAHRGHEIHFISYERPFRLSSGAPRIYFHPVQINDYGLFRYPDYTLPLSVKMAEVSRDYGLDVLHVHYAVPHATAAILACSMLEARERPRVVTTLHGTDTMLLGRDAGYGPAISHALNQSDAITAVSDYLKGETQRLLKVDRPIEVIHNFFVPRHPSRSRQEVRQELGISDAEVMILHSSNLRPVKRVDLLLDTIARIKPHDSFKLVILAGEDFSPFKAKVQRLGLEGRVIVREKVYDVEEYVQAADLGLITSETESFCLSILEAMYFACPSVATRVGGIPEVIDDQRTGVLVPFGDANTLARRVEELIQNPSRRSAMGRAAQQFARGHFAADIIVPRYEALYRRVCKE
ncbi:MAG: N-acetyl-alpha-D-glucosaminyl L-malate synthase BshA [Abitibacteriaceae bacterium]|nr:N-acetyl-alpha-D-glucosaminyl L-malate synthase BshA [Abditibacteriaceae bacterium]MBV9864129.1 N-acetyl-alpha-D-glucosaminyl L-malate synthase BshA [Abditibacteriaceae bacterium]